jgi:DNA-binding XRE family transcriptional regulator
MTADELIALRRACGLTQTEFAERVGMTLRPYQSLESGGEMLPRHVLAIERAALAIAVEKKAPMLAPPSVRRDALELCRLITG